MRLIRRLLRWVLMSIVFMCGGIAVLAIGYQLLTTPEQREQVSATADARRTETAVAVQATADAATDTPTSTITATATYQPDSDAAQMRTAQARTIDMFDDVPGVIGAVSGGAPGTASQDGDRWTVYVELIVAVGANNTETADAVLQAALSGLVSAQVDMSMILDDGMEAISYDWNNGTDSWTVTPLGVTDDSITPVSLDAGAEVVTIVTDTPEPVRVVATAAPVDTQIPRPRNCSTAVAMGLTAQQAAQFANLDRDKDGVACYGD